MNWIFGVGEKYEDSTKTCLICSNLHDSYSHWSNKFRQGIESPEDLARPEPARLAVSDENMRQLETVLDNLLKCSPSPWKLFLSSS